MKVYQRIAQLIDARNRCLKNQTHGPRVVDSDQDITVKYWNDMAYRHWSLIDQLVKDYLPSGSGWDMGTECDAQSSPNKLIFYGSFHHMNEGGMYDGWTEHTITVRPDLMSGFGLRIGGPNRNDIKEYLAEMFQAALNEEVKG